MDDNKKSSIEVAPLTKKIDRIFEGIPAGFFLRLVEKLHHITVMFDDFLCDELGFSRKAKGKYLER